MGIVAADRAAGHSRSTTSPVQHTTRTEDSPQACESAAASDGSRHQRSPPLLVYLPLTAAVSTSGCHMWLMH